MIFNKNDRVASYTVAFPHKQSSYAETYRVKDAAGKTRFLKLISYGRLNRGQIDDNGCVVEIEITKQLSHPNLCKYIDSGNLMLNGGQYAFLVTEYVSGETLSQKIIRDGDLSVYEIKQIAKAILAALSYLHQQQVSVIHGEVTIQNVLLNLVSGLDDLKLIDFGHACYLNQKPVRPDLDELNAFYLAPERFSGVNQIQSDLYSVGVMMYQLLYGELPWFIDVSRIKSEDKVDAILEERNRELDLPQIDKFELDSQLVNCIVKSLSYDVGSRFQTADEFIRAIDGAVVVERQSTKRRVLSTDAQISAKSVKPTIAKKGRGFAAIAGMDELKKMLREEVIEPLHNPEEYERYGVTIPNGMLLYGPPGCGKTFFAKHFAEEVGFNFMCVTPATLKSRYVNATQENIAQMFKEAEEKSPTIIFIDEMNELVPNRESNVHEMSRSAVNEMLAQMDRTGERGIFIIGATNYPHTIDPAILRAGRLDKKYFIGAPDKSARIALFKLYLEKRPYDFGLDYEELAALTENYVSADILLIVNDAARNALKSHGKITMAVLIAAIRNARPSLSVEDMKRYDEIRARMEGVVLEKQNKERTRIGFR
ncbi:cell division protein [Bacteroides heparinolyticus]|uniref:AAA family ATPase n=1 Tax=Prevotella heparinolytica TaxID=28113 RepID=UPI000D042808|nr:AAA family ATPase [Bacteroides heparinolyticus]AVM58239.1 cell division protein [Bacteroides heparinolyticus]